MGGGGEDIDVTILKIKKRRIPVPSLLFILLICFQKSNCNKRKAKEMMAKCKAKQIYRRGKISEWQCKHGAS